MGISQGQPGSGQHGSGQPGKGQRAYMVAVGYLLLLVLGGLQGMIGSFQYDDGPAPLVAIVLDLIIFATCLLAGLGLRTYGGGILPALGWLVASFVLAMPRPNGSVLITASSAGECYLYGGALAAAAGAATALIALERARRRAR